MAKYSGIFLIEDKAFCSGWSAEPFLETLKRYHEVQVEHRKAANGDELLEYVKQWAGEGWVYSILYFWSHGSPNTLWLGDEGNGQVSLDQIAQKIAGTWDGKAEKERAGLIHFGACSTLRLTDDSFLEASGVAAVSGYRVDVDWIDSLAFEMLYMSRIQSVASEMERDKDGADVYLTPDVMNNVWKQLDKDDGPTRNLVDHLHFDLRIASSTKG